MLRPGGLRTSVVNRWRVQHRGQHALIGSRRPVAGAAQRRFVTGGFPYA
jgi:hypothetical protein